MKANPKRPLRIAFVSGHDPDNVRAFSGTIYYMCRALRARLPGLETVRFVRPVGYDRFRNIVLRATNGRVNPDYWRWLNMLFARQLARRWRGQRVLVVSVVSAALASEVAERVPVVNITDSTFELMRDFYANFAQYSMGTARAGEEIERRSIVLSVHSSFSSSWAANSAIRHYGASPEKVSVLSWGCNLPRVAPGEVRRRQEKWSECRLLFIGVDWVRKGGDVVCAVGEILVARGVPIRIDIVGSSSVGGLPRQPWLHDHGFLSKSDETQKLQLSNLMRDSDFLFLPTLQDCTPMVFAEANAYGTAVITRAVGGVADVVRDGVNGIVLSEDARPEDFADQIEKLWRDPKRYWLLRQSSRREYEDRLNWDSWAKGIALIIGQLEADGTV